MRVAYLVNQYPKISHSFIRREILALEALGLSVQRYSVRPTRRRDVVDVEDLAEIGKTSVLLNAGIIGHVVAVLICLIRRPLRFARTLGLAMKCGWNSDRGLIRHLIYLAEACVLLRWLKHADSSHLHAHFGTNSTTVAMLCRELGGPPFSFTVHGPDEFDRAEHISLRLKTAKAKFVVAITSFCRAQLYRWSAQSDWEKIRIVRCGIGPEFFGNAAMPVSTPILSRKRQFASIGRLSPQKGQMLLVRAAAILAAEGRHFRVTIIGDGELRPLIEDLIRTHQLENYVELAGWVNSDGVRAHLAQSFAMCLPSFAEGLPVVAMESLAMARPVLATWIAGHPELMEDKQTGWMFPAGSVEALADAMRAALDASPEELERMGKEGRRRVHRLHNVMQEAALLQQYFEASGSRTLGENHRDVARCDT